jgi:hypothetical protein
MNNKYRKILGFPVSTPVEAFTAPVEKPEKKQRKRSAK